MSVIEAGREPILPTGEAGKLNQYVSENWGAHLVELAHVQNSVLWVNPEFKFAPFDLQIGKPTSLGMFVKGAFAQKPINLQAGQFPGETWFSNGRSILLGRFVITDNEGRMYRDIDIKGTGYVQHKHDVKRLGDHVGSMRDSNYCGLLDGEVAEYDQEMSERFLSLGIRASRTIAIIGLEQLIDGGKVVSVGNFLRKRNIPLDFKPVLQLRAFGTKARIKDVDYTGYIDAFGVELLVNDAKWLISQELGMNRIMFDREYLEWFAEALGKNVGLMHKNKLCHRYLISHNITLDCRIVDLDSVGPLETRKQLRDDFDNAYLMFDRLAWTRNLLVSGDFYRQYDRGFFEDLFSQSYGETFSPQEQKDYFKK